MTRHDRDNAAARPGKAGQTIDAHAERDAAARAVRDNMERLKALRLAKEAASPTPSVKRAKAGSKAGGKAASTASGKGAQGQDLSAWLASQRSGGYRT